MRERLLNLPVMMAFVLSLIWRQRGWLLIFDLGFLNFSRFDQLTDAGVWFLTRMEERTVYQVEKVLRTTAQLHERLVWVGSGPTSRCTHLLRLVEWQHQGKWYRYLTNVVEPHMLPAEYVVALYWQRWRIEDAFNVVRGCWGWPTFGPARSMASRCKSGRPGYSTRCWSI